MPLFLFPRDRNWLDRFLSSIVLPVLIGMQLAFAAGAIGVAIGGCVSRRAAKDQQEHRAEPQPVAPRPGS